MHNTPRLVHILSHSTALSWWRGLLSQMNTVWLAVHCVLVRPHKVTSPRGMGVTGVGVKGKCNKGWKGEWHAII